MVGALLGAGLVDRPRLVAFPRTSGETAREPIFEDLPDIDMVLIGTDVLDGRLVALEHRAANANPAGRAAPEEDHGPAFAASPGPATRP